MSSSQPAAAAEAEHPPLPLAAAAAAEQPPPPAAAAEPEEPPPPDWQTKEDEKGRSMVFLVTFAAVLAQTALDSVKPLRTLLEVTREVIRDAVLDAVANPVDLQPSGGRPRKNKPAVQMLVVALEEPRHFHVALKVTSTQRFLPFKQALRDRSGLASHWSTSHSEFWSALRYLVFGSAHKTQLDQVATMVQWSSNGQAMNLYEKSQQKFDAVYLKRRREAKEIQTAAEPALPESKKPRFSKIDFTALVLAENLTTPSAVMAYVKEKGSAGANAFVLRHQENLEKLLRGAKEWDQAEEMAALEKETEWELVLRLSKQRCACRMRGCQWWAAAQSFFRRQAATIDGVLLAACLVKVIQEGPGKCARVPLIAGVTNAAKSTMLDPVDKAFGHERVFHTPAMGSTMALANLANHGCTKRFLYMDEYEPVKYAAYPEKSPTVPATTFKKLLAGQHLEVQRSQCHNDGNGDIQWKKGAAMTAPLEGLWDLLGKVSREDVRHMQSRVVQFDALVAVPLEEMRDIPLCAESWSWWLVTWSAAFAARTVPSPMAPPAQEQESDPVWAEMDWDEF